MAYRRTRSAGFERFLHAVVGHSGGLPPLSCDVPDGEVLQWRAGRSGDDRLLFVTNGGSAADVRFAGPFDGLSRAHDILGDRPASLAPDGTSLGIHVDAGGSHVIVLSR
jgi:hypothetical protein